MEPIDYIKRKIGFIENSLDELKLELSRLEFVKVEEPELKTQTKPTVTKKLEPLQTEGTVDIKRLLGDETYRINLAIKTTKTLKSAADALGMSERTLYRKLIDNGISWKKIKTEKLTQN